MPSFLDNSFPSPSQHDSLSFISSGSAFNQIPISPVLLVETEDGDRAPGTELGSDSDSDALTDISFSSLRTVEDGGLGMWEPQSSSDMASPTITKSPDLVDGLQGVGSSYYPSQVVSAPAGKVLLNNRGGNGLQEFLEEQIRFAFVTSGFDQRGFLPLDELNSIINQETTRKLLKHAYPDWSVTELKGYVNDICGLDRPGTGRRKLLAVLVLMNKAEYIVDFIRYRVQDLHLPLEVKWDRSKHRFQMSKKEDENLPNPFPYCSTWSHKDMQCFSNFQNYMLAPYFRLTEDDVYHYKLSRTSVLPFTIYGHRMEGLSDKTYQIKIHKAHHDFKACQVVGDLPSVCHLS